MTDFIDDLMGYNPQDLDIFQDQPSAGYDANVYKTNPKNSTSKDGHYHSKIRVLYNPFNTRKSIVHQATYAMKDANGFFMVKSKLGDGDKSCPIFTSWKKLWFSGDETKKEWAKKMYDKSESQWVLVQVLEDKNKPELTGQFLFMKLPKAIYEKMNAKMNPSEDSGNVPVPIMDYLIGQPLVMDVKPGPDDPEAPMRKQREVSYAICDFKDDYAPITKVDGTPLFEPEELETIDSYVTAKTDLVKAKTEAKKKAAEKTIESLYDQMKVLYKKALDYMKENAGDLVKECTYQPWDEATTKRVMDWIAIVAKMQDPATTVVEVPTAEELTKKVEKTQEEIATEQKMKDPFTDAADDALPF